MGLCGKRHIPLLSLLDSSLVTGAVIIFGGTSTRCLCYGHGISVSSRKGKNAPNNEINPVAKIWSHNAASASSMALIILIFNTV